MRPNLPAVGTSSSTRSTARCCSRDSSSSSHSQHSTTRKERYSTLLNARQLPSDPVVRCPRNQLRSPTAWLDNGGPQATLTTASSSPGSHCRLLRPLPHLAPPLTVGLQVSDRHTPRHRPPADVRHLQPQLQQPVAPLKCPLICAVCCRGRWIRSDASQRSVSRGRKRRRLATRQSGGGRRSTKQR